MARDALFVSVNHDQLRTWETCLQELREPESEAQQEAAAKLKGCVERAVKDLSTEQFMHFEETVHDGIFKLLEEKVTMMHRMAIGTYCLSPSVGRFHRMNCVLTHGFTFTILCRRS